jgi:hypothetical protein
MATITQQKIINGLLEDGKNVQRTVASSISQLKSQTDLMAQISAYLFTELSNPDGVVDAEYIQTVTAQFQAQLVPLLTDILPKLQAIEACGNAENGAANVQAMITAYGLSPATFADRYK